MEFRLIYQGPLAANGDAQQKHTIRKVFHKQLQELFRQHPPLKDQTEQRYIVYTTPHNLVSEPGPGVRVIQPAPTVRKLSDPPLGKPWIEWVAADYTKLGYRFVPLISKSGGFTCSLDILFLRRDNPGHFIFDGGDIDNRLKTLFDALRMPDSELELGGFTVPDADEDPFFCLLEDDKLITGLTVTADRLLSPITSEKEKKHVHLIIRVTMNDMIAPFNNGRMI